MAQRVKHKLSRKVLDALRVPPSCFQDLVNLDKRTRVKDYAPKLIKNGFSGQWLSTTKENLEILLKKGLVKITFGITNDGNVNTYYKRTEIGEAIAEVCIAMNRYVRNAEEKMSLRKAKYTKTDYDKLVELPLELKILRSQKAILKACLAFDVLLHKGTVEHARLSWGQKRHVAVLHHLVGLVKETLANIATIDLPKKILSSYSIEEIPDIFYEWSINGCYDENANVNFPLAIWTKKDYAEYIKRFMKGDENANLYFDTSNDKSD